MIKVSEDLLKKLKLYFEINNLNDIYSEDIIYFITKGYKILNFSKKGIIYKFIEQFLNGHISLEKLFLMGDILGKQNLETFTDNLVLESLFYIERLKKFDNKLFLIDKTALDYFVSIKGTNNSLLNKLRGKYYII